MPEDTEDSQEIPPELRRALDEARRLAPGLLQAAKQVAPMLEFMRTHPEVLGAQKIVEQAHRAFRSQFGTIRAIQDDPAIAFARQALTPPTLGTARWLLVDPTRQLSRTFQAIQEERKRALTAWTTTPATDFVSQIRGIERDLALLLRPFPSPESVAHLVRAIGEPFPTRILPLLATMRLPLVPQSLPSPSFAEQLIRMTDESKRLMESSGRDVLRFLATMRLPMGSPRPIPIDRGCVGPAPREHTTGDTDEVMPRPDELVTGAVISGVTTLSDLLNRVAQRSPETRGIMGCPVALLRGCSIRVCLYSLGAEVTVISLGTRYFVMPDLAALIKRLGHAETAQDGMPRDGDAQPDPIYMATRVPRDCPLLLSLERLRRGIAYPVSEGARADHPDLELGEPKDEIIHFPTPEGATWADIAIRFVDAHTVSIRCGDLHRSYHYAEMGFNNRTTGKPNAEWELLRSFAKGSGTVRWGDPWASNKLKKRKERLAKGLRQFFGLPANPFLRYDQQGHCWICLFRIREEE
jgi:hypothetical protein